MTAVFPGLATLAGRLTASALFQYTEDAKPYVAFCQQDAEAARQPATLRAWCQWMVEQTTLSPHTINRRLAAVKTLVKASARCGAMPPSLAAGFQLIDSVSRRALRGRLKWHPGRLTAEQVRTLCRVPDPTTLGGLRDRALLFTLATSGCRLREAVALHLEHIQRHQGRLVLIIWGKAQEQERLAPLAEEAFVWIARWLRARTQAGVQVSRLFTQMRQGGKVTPKPLARQGAYHNLVAYAKQLGLPRFRPHDLRAFVATEVYFGCDIKTSFQSEVRAWRLGALAASPDAVFFAEGVGREIWL